MRSVDRILVAVDLSPCAHAAFRYATYLTHRFGADLGLLYVQEPSLRGSGSLTGQFSETARGDGDAEEGLGGRPRHIKVLLEYVARCLLGPGEWAIEASVARGDPVQEIRKAVKQGGFDLLVVGRHGDHRPSGLGEVARALLADPPCPVVPVWVAEPGAQPIARVEHSEVIAADALVRRYDESDRIERDRAGKGPRTSGHRPGGGGTAGGR